MTPISTSAWRRRCSAWRGRASRWFIESGVKLRADGSRQYSDVGTLLILDAALFLERHHAQVTRFTPGSGDKDLRVVVGLARQHGIPVHVVVVDKTANLSRELNRIADGVRELAR